MRGCSEDAVEQYQRIPSPRPGPPPAAKGLRDTLFAAYLDTRLGEAGADAFSIMRAMGHGSVAVSQKYVHPTPEAMERAFERLDALKLRGRRECGGRQKAQLLAL